MTSSHVKDPLLEDAEMQRPHTTPAWAKADTQKNQSKVKVMLDLLDGWWPLIVSSCLMGAGMEFGLSMLVAAGLSAGTLLKERTRAQTAAQDGAKVIFPKTLDLGQLLLYLVLTLFLFGWPQLETVLTDWNEVIINAGYALIILASLLSGRPFVLEYAAETVPAYIQRRPGFLRAMYEYTRVWLWVFLAMTCSTLVAPLFQTVYGKQIYYVYAWAFELLQYLLLFYGFTFPQRQKRKRALLWGMGIADTPGVRIFHPPKRIVDASGVVLPWILDSGRLHPRPNVIYKKPDSSESDMLPNFQVVSAPSLQHAGVPRGPWSMRFKCFYEIDDRPRRCAVLIDDVQEEYCKFFPETYLAAQMSILEAARVGGTPVFWSYWWRLGPDDGGYCALDEFYGPYGMENPEFRGMNAAYLSDPNGADLPIELKPRNQEECNRVIKSTYFDCFANVDEAGNSLLKSSLDAMCVDTLVLTGCWTDACIIATCIRAVQEDFCVIVPEDAVFSCTTAAASALDVMRNGFAKVVLASEVSAYLKSAS